MGRLHGKQPDDLLEPLRFTQTDNRWTVVPNDAVKSFVLANSRAELTVATLNVLLDAPGMRSAYIEPSVHADERFTMAIDALQALNADIIGLQEVTPHFAHHLLCTEWIRRDYWISCGSGHPSLDPYGQLFLSRLPMHRIRSHPFGKHSIKRALLGNFQWQNRWLIVANIHLPSDHVQHPDLAEQDRRHRQGQLKKTLSMVEEEATEMLDTMMKVDRLVLGDFNFGDDSSEENAPLSGYHDSWLDTSHTRCTEGFTLDPEHNSIASALSPQLLGCRTDRILYLSESDTLVPVRTHMFGTQSFSRSCDHQSMHISDHFGLCTLFRCHERCESQGSGSADQRHQTASSRIQS